ncbi:MAG: DNA topoisomerase (ATP-hydrolyzing) subunit A [Pseudanabaenaceae cyanobacterium]
MSRERSTQIIPTALHVEMQRSYLEYAMSVIVGRALPDVRDGLKPVQRRILYAMHELGLSYDRPFRKCARVVGDVLGKYHPHGDQSVYEALVRMVQDFSCRYPLLAGHGNFGSIDDDPPAAMRYTECRLGEIGQMALLTELNPAIVDFIPNFDGAQLEPVVLPARLPVLLMNGAGGIAVGMATNIPPHNLSELVEGMIALIDHPQLSDDELIELIPAPDFPTGGIIVDDGSIQETYKTGRGSIILRGRATIEQDYRIKGKRTRQAIIVTELPFQVNKSAWIEKVAELTEQGKIEDILDVRDESDREGLRVVIEVKKEANAELILEKLYRQTTLQTNFGVILLAVKPTDTGSQPKQMSLKELLQEFLQFREITLTRKYQYELNQAQEKLHLVTGFLTAIARLPEVISLISRASDPKSAKTALQENLVISEMQSEAILSLPLRRLTTLEREKLHQESTDLQQEINRLQKLLSDRKELLKAMKKDLRELKKLYGDPRRTEIVKLTEVKKEVLPAQLPEQKAMPVLIQVSYKGYIRTVDPDAKFSNLYSQPDDTLMWQKEGLTNQELLVFTQAGKAIPLPVSRIPLAKNSKQKGVPLVTLLPDEQDQPISYTFWQREVDSAQSIVIVSTTAKIKRTPLSEFQYISSRGLLATKLKSDEQLFWAETVDTQAEILLATSTGRILRMRADEEQIPTLSRTATGNIAMRLGTIESLIGVVSCNSNRDPQSELVLVTKLGFGRRIRVDSLRLAPRGSIGTQAIKFHTKEDQLSGIALISNPESYSISITVVVANHKEHTLRFIQIPLMEIPHTAHQPQGRYILAGSNELQRGEEVSAVIVPNNSNN